MKEKITKRCIQINFFLLQRENWKTKASKHFTAIIPCIDSNGRQYQGLLEAPFRSGKRYSILNWTSETQVFQSFQSFLDFKVLKVVSAACFLVCFVILKESTGETARNNFFFYFKSSLRSWNHQILDFQIFKLLMFWFSSIKIYYKWNNHCS